MNKSRSVPVLHWGVRLRVLVMIGALCSVLHAQSDTAPGLRAERKYASREPLFHGGPAYGIFEACGKRGGSTGAS
jgi:hypothetical protein